MWSLLFLWLWRASAHGWHLGGPGHKVHQCPGARLLLSGSLCHLHPARGHLCVLLQDFFKSGHTVAGRPKRGTAQVPGLSSPPLPRREGGHRLWARGVAALQEPCVDTEAIFHGKFTCHEIVFDVFFSH